MPYEIEVTRRVEFSDTDMAGIMHFANFFRFMETAEHAFFRSLGHSVVLSRSGLNLGLPRGHAECDYLAPLRFEDEVLIHLLVERKGTRSLTYRFHFHCLNRHQEVARGRLTVVCAARRKDGSFKAVPLPKFIADRIQVTPAELLEVKTRSRVGDNADRALTSAATNRVATSRAAARRVAAPRRTNRK